MKIIRKNITIKEIEKLKPGVYYSADNLVKIFRYGDIFGSKNTYDISGNHLTYKNICGFGHKSIYDKNGIKNTYEDSDGVKGTKITK